MRTSDGATWRRHANQMRSTLINLDALPTPESDVEIDTKTVKSTLRPLNAYQPAAATTHTRQQKQTAETAQRPHPVIYERFHRKKKTLAKFQDFVMK